MLSKRSVACWCVATVLACGAARADDGSIFDMEKPPPAQTPPPPPEPVNLSPTPADVPAPPPPVAKATATQPTTAAVRLTDVVAAKRPAPSPADLTQASRDVAEAYPNSVAAKTPLARIKAARQLMDVAGTYADHPAEQYAVLETARDLFQAAADGPDACSAVDAIDHRFEVDAVHMRCDAAAAGKSAASTWASHIDRQCAVPAIVSAADAAIATGHLEWAVPLDTQARSLAAVSGDMDLATEVAAHERERSEARSAWTDAARAQTLLRSHPNNTAACLADGWFKCVIAGTWDAGLPLLAGGSYKALAAAAKAELSGDTITAADRWWDYAQTPAASAKQHSLVHRQLLTHAEKLYAAAEVSSAGLTRERIRKRLAELTDDPRTGAVRRRVDLLRQIDLTHDVISGKWQQAPGGGLACEAGDLARIAIAYFPPVAYEENVSFTRTAGDEAIDIYAVGNGRQFTYALGGWKNSICGFNFINEKLADQNGTAVHGKFLINDHRATAVVRVHPDAVEVYLNGRLLSHRITDYADMSLGPDHLLNEPDELGLSAFRASFIVYSAVLVELDPRHTVLPPSEVKVVSARWGGGNNWADVTPRVTKLLAAGLLLWATNQTLGVDPMPGWRKHFEITYVRRGQTNTTSVDEDHKVILP